MSSQITKFGLLSFVSAALAAPFYPSGYSAGTGAPYGLQNTTGPYAPTGSGSGSPSFTATETVTSVVELTAIAVSTIHMGASSVEAADVSTADVCGPETITVTASTAVTVTITPGAGSPEASYPSSVVAAAFTSSSKAAYHQHGHHHSSKAPVPSSAAYTAPVYSAPEVSTYAPLSSVAEVSSVAAVVSTPAAVSTPAVISTHVAISTPAVYSSVEAPSSVVAPSSAAVSSAKPSATPVSSSGGKRGLLYNLASLTDCFESVKSITWAYNWGQTSDGLPSVFEYIPMLWGLRDDFTSTWETNWKAAVAKGTKIFLGFNEPDHPQQANLTPEAAAAGWKTYMEPIKASDSSIRLGSPGVTNGDNGWGIDWLVNFQTACSGCHIDFAAIHWYQAATDDMVAYFKSHVEEAHTRTGLNVWVTEFAFTSGSDDEIASALKNVMEWMDAQDYVERYGYYKIGDDGKLVSGTAMSTIGQAYAS